MEIEKQQPKTREGEGEEEGDDDEEEEAFNPADWANLMKKATQKDKLDDDEANRDAAPQHRDRVFDSNASTAKSFAELGVPETLIKIMSESVDLQFTTPTLVQQLAVPSILNGRIVTFEQKLEAERLWHTFCR